MFCNMCGKNPASLHYSQVINNKVTELHLCEVCAKKQGISLQKHFSVSDFLAGISDVEMGVKQNVEKEQLCDFCGFTFSNFKKIGTLGCPHCYTTFEPLLKDLIKRIHGSEMHVGKATEKREVKNELNKKIMESRMELKKAIEEERYEDAARIRDEIKIIENPVNSDEAKED